MPAVMCFGMRADVVIGPYGGFLSVTSAPVSPDEKELVYGRTVGQEAVGLEDGRIADAGGDSSGVGVQEAQEQAQESGLAPARRGG